MASQTSHLNQSPAQAPKVSASTPSLPQGIEVFAAGSQLDSQGRPWSFDEAMLDDMIGSYDPSVHEAPFIVGHAEEQSAAYAWTQNLFRNQKKLHANHQQADPQFAEMVKSGRFKKRSISVYLPDDPTNPKPGHYYLRHIAFLGAQPPAVKGLKNIEFNSNDSTITFVQSVEPEELEEPKSSRLTQISPTHFSEKGKPMAETSTTPAAAVPTPESQERISELKEEVTKLKEQVTTITAERDALKTENTTLKEQIEAIKKAEDQAEEAAIVAFAEGMIKEGRLLPKDKVTTVAVMNSLRKAEPLNFTEGNTTRTITQLEAYQNQLKASQKIINFGEAAGGNGISTPAADDDELDRQARAYQASHPEVDYVTAIKAVQAGATV